MKEKKIFNVSKTALLGGVALGLVLSGAPAKAATSGTSYNIDVLLPLTGSSAFLGNSEQHTLVLEQKVINQGDGVHGHPVNFAFHDDQSNPQISVQLTNQLLAAHPVVLLGSSIVGSCNAMAPLVKNGGPMMYCFSPGVHPKAGSYEFSASVSTGDMIAATLHYFQARGWTRIGVLFSTDATGQDAAKSIAAQMSQPQNKGLTLVSSEHFSPTDLTVDPEIQSMKAADPQAIIVWTTGTPLGTALRGIANAGWKVPVATTHSNLNYKQMTQYKAFIPADFFIPSPEGVFPASDIPGEPPAVASAKADMFNAYAAETQKPDTGAALVWDPVLITMAALNALPADATAEQVRAYIAGLKNYSGTNGLYDMTAHPQRGLGLANVIVTRWDDATHKFVVVAGPGGDPLK